MAALCMKAGMSDAVSIAELALARALSAVWRAQGPEEEVLARARVLAAEQDLERAKATPIGRDQRLCCGRPMLWSSGGWICALGAHDD